MSETESLQAFIKNRSEEAFQELVRRYAGLVYSVAKRRLGNTGSPEDITQLVFIRFANNPPKVSNPAQLTAWLHRTTLNVTVDVWRSETRRRNREQKALSMDPSATDNAIWDEVAPKLDAALNALNEDDRQALLLRFFGNKSMRDVGTGLGVSEDAAKMRVSRAIQRLRDQLGSIGGACTAATLGTVLQTRSVEAAPVQLISRLASIKIPAATGAVGGLLTALQQSAGVKFAVAAGLVTIFAAVIMSLLQPQDAKPVASPGSQPRPHSNISPAVTPARRIQRDSSALTAATKPIKGWFHVLDSETGLGLANTKIEIVYFGIGGQEEGHEVFTDDRGDAGIPAPDDPAKKDGPNIFVTAEGHVPKSVGFRKGLPADYTIKMDPSMTVGGLIVDDQGSPVSGVTIHIQGDGDKRGQIENVDFQTAPVTSRDYGSWTCSYVPKTFTNEIRLILNKKDYAVTDLTVPVTKVALTNIVLVINRGFTITGQITDTQSQPINKARARVLTWHGPKEQSVETDENGMFTFAGIDGGAGPRGFYKDPPIQTNSDGATVIHGLVAESPLQEDIVVQADGFAPQTQTVYLRNATNIANFSLSPGNMLRGHVTDEAGNPLTNVLVQTDWNSDGLRAYQWRGYTDPNGEFEWSSAPQDSQLYWFERDGYEWKRGIPLTADSTDHQIILRPKAVNKSPQ